MFAWLFDLLFPIRTDEKIVRDLFDDEFLSLLAPEVVERTNPPAVALLPFSDRRVRAAIHEAKYHGSERAFLLLAAALVEYLRENDSFDGLRDHVLVPVPLGRERRRSRGFNQAEEVALRAGKELAIPVVTELLTRTRETSTQVSLPKAERARNMRGAFSASQATDPSLTYILIDDVTTTGATLSAALSALQEAGATSLRPIALAH